MSITIGLIQRIFNNLISITNTTLDGYTIGSITPEPATFTTLTATTSNLGTVATGTLAGGTLINNAASYCQTATSYVSTATLQALPGYSATLLSSGIYAVEGFVPVTTATNAAGVQLALNATNSLTFKSPTTVVCTTLNGTTVTANNIVTAAATDMVNAAGTCTDIRFLGTIYVATGGTLGLSSAQHTSSASTSTIGAGGYLRVTRMA